MFELAFSSLTFPPTAVPFNSSLKLIEEIPLVPFPCECRTSIALQLSPASWEKNILDLSLLPVPNQIKAFPDTAIDVPLTAIHFSPFSAGGIFKEDICFQVSPPSVV